MPTNTDHWCTGDIWTGERCFIRELVNDPQQPAASLARCRVTPGTLTQLHRLSVTEWYSVLSGSGEMYVEGQQMRVIGAGDTVHIAAGLTQQVRNSGDSDLIFDCLCMPRFTPECYQNAE